MNEYTRKMLLLAAMYAAMDRPSSKRGLLDSSPKRKWQSWDNIQLSKAERKGKTFEEMQALRKQKWEALQTA